jgi:hypothetical protein
MEWWLRGFWVLTSSFAGVIEGGARDFFVSAMNYEWEFCGRKGWRVEGARAV